MKMKKIIKKGSALALALVLTLSVTVLPKVYAAIDIDKDRSCSITFELDGEYEELNQLAVPIHLYKVAEVEETGEYKALPGYEELDLGSISDETNAEEWEKMAGKASELVKTLQAEPNVSTEMRAAEGQPTGTAGNIPTGMYLVAAESVKSAEYVYDFTPYLISLPNNYYYSSGSDEWVYDVTTGLKPSQTELFGDLVIEKTLTSYNATLGSADFVFQVDAEKDMKIVYSDVVSLSFDAPGTRTAKITHIPAGAQVTVTEVYSGASYQLTSSETQTAVILADDAVSVSFENEYNDHLNGGSSVVNHFIANDGNWDWEQQRDNSGQE